MLRVLEGSRGSLNHGVSTPLLLKHTPGVSLRHGSSVVVAGESPKGFGPAPSKTTLKPLSAQQEKKVKSGKKQTEGDKDDAKDDEVPEIVTNRMLKRIGVSIAVPLVLSVVSYLGFYGVKENLNVDYPEWLPLLVSGLFVGSSAFGIFYGIISTSWDPVHDGSFWGWKEAQVNWPLFFQSEKSVDGKQ